jgi:hypothetical protein
MTYDSQFTPTRWEGKGFLSPAHKFIYKLIISIMGLCITVDSGRKITRFLFLVFYIVINYNTSKNLFVFCFKII